MLPYSQLNSTLTMEIRALNSWPLSTLVLKAFNSYDGYTFLQLYSSYKLLFAYFLINFLLYVQVRNSTCLDQPAKPAEQALSVATVN